MKTIVSDSPTPETRTPPAAMLTGAVVFALLSASCCVLPIGLSVVGLGGAWLTLQGSFVAYRLPILSGLGLILAWSWFSILRPSADKEKRPRSARLASIATLAFAISATQPIWQASAESAMWTLWRATQ